MPIPFALDLRQIAARRIAPAAAEIRATRRFALPELGPRRYRYLGFSAQHLI
jgi:hypothetical protein